jgi:DNA-binding beta-propeller fold protein YncE
LLNTTRGLAFDSAGNLYAANEALNTIAKITPGGVVTVFASTGLNNPFGLAFDTAGNLYAANYGDNTIEKFTPGGVGSVFASTGLNLPFGLAFDSAGNLFAANLNSATIEKFTPGGVGSLFATTTVGPTALAFGPTISSVPEPSTLVLSSMGLLGLIGINLIRRRLPILEKK